MKLANNNTCFTMQMQIRACSLLQKLNYLSLIIIISQEDKTQQKKMMNQNTQQYYILYVYTVDGQATPVLVTSEQYMDFLIRQTQSLKLERTTLIEEINYQSEQRERIESHNVELRNALQVQGTRNKRRYRKRRVWLEKKYRCNIKGCSNKYSSKIALNSHKRKKHPKKGKEMI